MNAKYSVITLSLSLTALGASPSGEPKAIENGIVYKEKGRFGGWPANHGIWCWGDEILTGFSRGYYKDLGPGRHAIDRERPEEHWLARSLDGGHTWTLEDPSIQGVLVARGNALHGTEPDPNVKEPIDCPGGIDFTHPGFAMTLRMLDGDVGPSLFYTSIDRGKNWQGPFRFSVSGNSRIAARTDYIVDGPHDCTLFLTASKSDNTEGRPLCARTRNGGKTWDFVSWIGPEPDGFSIMPSAVRLSKTNLAVALRRREGDRRWIETYRSTDDGKSWKYLSTPAGNIGEGNPPSMIRLHDGRLCLTYGYRAEPFGIRAQLSNDDGATWSDPIHLRDDGGGRDLGYTRTVQRPDGNIVTVYYFTDKVDVERSIAFTIWDPGDADS